MNRLRNIGIFVLINSGIYILVWGSVYALRSLLLGRPFGAEGLMQIFQPFTLITQGTVVEWTIYVVISTALWVFSWVFEALTWWYMTWEEERISGVLQPVRTEG